MTLRAPSIALLLGLAACDSGTAHHDLGVDAGTNLAASNGTTTWSGTIAALQLTDAGMVPDGGFMTLDQAQICLVGTASCSLGDGTFSFALPNPDVGSSAGFGASAVADGYLGQTIFAGIQVTTNAVGTGTAFTAESGANLMADGDAEAFLAKGGIAYPATETGYVSVVLRSATNGQLEVAGGTVSLSSASTKTVYADASGDLDTTLTSTSSSGLVYFAGVAPGPFTITANVPGMTCKPLYDYGFPGEGTNKMSAELVAGTIAYDLQLICQ